VLSRVLFYTAALVGAFLLLTNYKAANELIRSGFRGYGGVVGILQGRDVKLTGDTTSVGAIAR